MWNQFLRTITYRSLELFISIIFLCIQTARSTKIVVRQRRTIKKSATAFAVPAGPSTPPLFLFQHVQDKDINNYLRVRYYQKKYTQAHKVCHECLTSFLMELCVEGKHKRGCFPKWHSFALRTITLTKTN